MDATANLLFDYLRAIVYDPASAALDPERLDKEYVRLGKGLIYLAEALNEQQAFAASIAQGDLSKEVKGNAMNAPLKALQASLRHMTWQTQQVAKGDYSQRLDFLGEFSTAFNAMVEQLEAQRASLEREIDVSHTKTRSLIRANMLLASITASIPEPIVVLNKHSKELLFQNRAAVAALKEYPSMLPAVSALVHEQDIEHAGEADEVILDDAEGRRHYFSTLAYELDWQGQSAAAFMLNDVSEDKERFLQLERHAYLDPLTGLHNRFFGMKTLNEWIAAKKRFVLCFVDLDFLKYINDTFGHQEGDKYILYAARLLDTFARGAVACRVGGDEFLILAPDYTFESAEPRFLQMVEQMNRHNRQTKNPFSYSMSFGVVEIPSDNRMSASDALSLADERMYEYKRRSKKARAAERPNFVDDRLPQGAEGEGE